MAFSSNPQTWLGTGYTNTAGSTHTISFTTNDASGTKALTELTDAEAHQTTGDIREIMRALCKKFYDAYVAQGTNIPNRMQVFKQGGANSSGTIIETYTLQFEVTPATLNVTAE